MIELVISGGQTGADMGGWLAGKCHGIACSGWMPLGFLTENGPRPEYAEQYGAKQHSSPKYPPRTRQNILDANATIIFQREDIRSPGTKMTIEMAAETRKPHRIVTVVLSHPWWYTLRDFSHRARDVAEWVNGEDFRSINVAGPRESKSPGIESFVQRYMTAVFRLSREGQPTSNVR